jgi:uncharacterized membrane protein HdeD (DUF308 family)
MTTTTVIDDLFHSRLRPAAGRLLWLGIAMTVLGLVAIAFPMASTLAVTLFIGWLMFLSGAITLVGSFSLRGVGPFFAALLFSLLSLVVGFYLLMNPAAGATGLTLAVGVIFATQAAYEGFFALELRPHPGWGAMLISAIASAVLAGMIIAGWPSVSMIVLGILFGVNFLTTGVGYIMISRALKAAA